MGVKHGCKTRFTLCFTLLNIFYTLKYIKQDFTLCFITLQNMGVKMKMTMKKK